MLQIVEYLLQWYDRKSRLWGCNNVYKIGHKVERIDSEKLAFILTWISSNLKTGYWTV
jgi:hypothetical protein